MVKRDQLLLAAKIFQNKDYFEFHSTNGVNIDSVDIEIVDIMSDEFEHQNTNRVNKIVFSDKDVQLLNPNIFVIIPDFLYTYIQIIDVDSTNKLAIVLNDVLPIDLFVAFQIAFNRIKYEESHQQKSPKDFEEKMINEMLAFDKH